MIPDNPAGQLPEPDRSEGSLGPEAPGEDTLLGGATHEAAAPASLAVEAGAALGGGADRPDLDDAGGELQESVPGPAFRRVKVIDVHLDRPLATLFGLEGYGGVQALVRLHGDPLGFVRLPVTAGRCPTGVQREAIVAKLGGPILLHVVEDRLARGLGASEPESPLLGTEHAAPGGREPFVTVAVCTRDHPAGLARCLESIARQDYEHLEVLVVDNAPSTAATESLVAGQWPQVRYVKEERPGLDWARNRAVREARGEVVAFTDDDVVVDPGWVAAIASAFGDGDDVAAVTGLVVPLELETRAQVLFEIYGGFGRGFRRTVYRFGPRERGHVGAGRFGTGANMSFRTDVVERLGGFDPALDVGTVTNGGGDIEMFFRVLQEGYTLVYEPAAIARHRHRRTHEELRIQLTNHGMGFYAFAVRSVLAYPQQRRSFVTFSFWWLLRWIIRRLLVSMIRPGRFPAGLVLDELRGGLIGLVRYPRARRAAARLGSSGPAASPAAAT
jgi:glycosyltransferase involved in cell wall biosynthesis